MQHLLATKLRLGPNYIVVRTQRMTRRTHPMPPTYSTRNITVPEAMELLDWYIAHCPASELNRDAHTYNWGVFQDLIVLSERCHPHQDHHTVSMDVMLCSPQEAMLFKLVWA